MSGDDFSYELVPNDMLNVIPSSSFSLRKHENFNVYAKLYYSEIDSQEHFVWGHYVTNWEENGYKEFSNLEEAYDFYGLSQENLDNPTE